VFGHNAVGEARRNTEKGKSVLIRIILSTWAASAVILRWHQCIQGDQCNRHCDDRSHCTSALNLCMEFANTEGGNC
jgi:hypothetical protein